MSTLKSDKCIIQSLISIPLISGVANSLFERSCVLFNYGAVSSQFAASQNLDTDDGLKLAAKYFQVCCQKGLLFITSRFAAAQLPDTSNFNIQHSNNLKLYIK